MLRRLETSKSRFALAQFVISLCLALSVGSVAAQQQIPAGFRAYQLGHARADDVAAELRRIIHPAEEILVDRSLNRVLVRDSAENDRMVTQLIQTFDRPAPVPNVAERPGSDDVVVRGYPVDAPKLEDAAAEVRTRYGLRSGVKIATDKRTNQLIVVARPASQTEIASYLAARKFAGEQAGVGGDPHIGKPVGPWRQQSFQLKHISWKQFEDTLDRIWQNELSVSTEQNGEIAYISLPPIAGPTQPIRVDRRTSVMSVEGPERVIKEWSTLLAAIDVSPTKSDQVSEIIPSRGVDSAKVQRAVALVQSLSQEGQAKVANAIVQLADRQRSRGWGGALVSTIFQPASQSQQPPAPAPGGAAGNQPPQAQPGAAEEGGLIGPVQIEILEATGQIIIRGHPRDVERVKAIINQIIEQSRLTQPKVEIYLLKHLNGQAVADLVTQLYSQVYEARQGPVTITALGKPNALLLVGSPENVESVMSLIRQLDQPVPPQTLFEVFQLRWMSALDAEQRLAAFFQGQTQIAGQAPTAAAGTAAGAVQGGLAARVRVVADYRSNSLVVQASPNDMDEVARFIRKIDVVQSQAHNEVKIFKLRNALADELAPVLQDALNGQLQGAGIGRTTGVAGAQQIGQQQIGVGQQQVAQIRSAMLSLMTVDSKTGRLLKSGIMFDVRVSADTNSNSLIVTGPAENMELIEALIEQLDQLPSAEAQIKVFTIINGDATTLLDMLQTLFGQQQVGGAFGQAGALGQLPLQTGAGETSLVQLRFAIDVRTNSIIASGSEGDLNVVEALLTRLDLSEIESRKTTVYRLHNAPALDVADALNQLLAGQRTINQMDPNVISPFEQIEREVVVVPELITNSLIVSATPQYFDEIKRIVADLDRRPPMVMIQVLIAEVTLDNIKEVGVELGIQDSLLFDRGIGVVGFPFNQRGIGNNSDATSLATRDSALGQALSNLNIGRTNTQLGYGGLVLSAGSDSVNVLIRALQQRGRIQILSRPQIMTMDNLAAFVQVGQRVARVSSVSQNQAGGTTFSAPDVNVGILLGVTPRTSSDGLIVMEINAEKSEVGSELEGTPIFVDDLGNIVRIPPIEVTTAQTTVSARSGQTVVFAGLISKNTVFTRRGMPYVSDWPVLGPLFRFDAEQTTRTELLIILTPFIINGDQDVEWINNREAERMNWCLADVVEVHGETSFTGKYGYVEGAQPEVVYPDLDPTGTEGSPIPPKSMPEAPSQSGALNSADGIDQANQQSNDSNPSSKTALGPLGQRLPGNQIEPPASPSVYRPDAYPRISRLPDIK